MSDLGLLPLITNYLQTQNSTETSTTENVNTGDQFNQLFSAMMISQSFGTGGSTSDESGNGLFSNGLFSQVGMYLLLEQLLAQTIQNQTLFSEPVATIQGATFVPTEEHINQFAAEIQVGGDGANSNCGPTSLVMALRALGLGVAGETAGMSAGQRVDLARKSMISDAGRNGIALDGSRSEAEHNTYTNFNDLLTGARAAGASAATITPSAESVRSALANGGKVIVSGTFAGKYPLPWTGDRGVDNASAPGGATAHLIAVTGIDPETGGFIVHDPARNQKHVVSADALENFMRGNAGAMAMYRS